MKAICNKMDRLSCHSDYNVTYRERERPSSSQGINTDHMIPLVEKRSLQSSIHYKQLSVDSTSPRMKYNFNSSPNLKPKSIATMTATTRSTPGTPNLSTMNRHRQPPPPPPALTTNHMNSDDDSVEIKTIPRCRSVQSSPSKSIPSLDLESSESTPVPPRRKRRTKTNLSLNSHQTRSLNNSPQQPRKSSNNADDGTITKPRRQGRRTPPLPPKNVTTKEETDHSHTIGMQTVSNDITQTSIECKTNGGTLKSSQQGKVEPIGIAKGTTKDITSPPITKKPPGLLFTPPHSRSQSLRNITSKHNKFFPHDVTIIVPRSNTLTPALTKPLPPLPSISKVSKPLPPLPIAPLPPLPIEPSSADSDYSYIPDYPDGHNSSLSSNQRQPVSHDYSNSLSESLGEYVCMTGKTVGERNPSQVGYTQDEYISMAAGNLVDTDHLLSDVFREDSEYIPMIYNSQSVDQKPDHLKNINNIKRIEEEYVNMSGIGENLVQDGLKALTLPSSINRSRQQLFDYNSMYIDLDMIREPPQHDNEAKHPKSRFSISSEPSSNSRKEENTSEKTLESIIDENQLGIYATIPDIH